MDKVSAPSNRQRIRDEAVRVLQAADGGRLSITEIAARVLPALGLAKLVTVKTVSNSLHEDPQRRFLLVARGTWELNPLRSLRATGGLRAPKR